MRRIRVLRQGLGISAAELGRRARVHPSDVSCMELGRKTPPDSSPVLRRLARSLGWTGAPAALLEEVDNGKAAS
jgi:transcriptional regulator with XRE-family HTH domain